MTSTRLTVVAEFPRHYTLENLVAREDGSLLVTTMTQKELWYVPPGNDAPVSPELLHTFPFFTTAIVEAEPDLFYVVSSDVYDTHQSHLHRLDLRGWTPGCTVHPTTVLTFDERAGGLNGGCMLGETSMLVADSLAGLIWRVELPTGDQDASVGVWLAHETMNFEPPQPGVNGVRYAASTGAVFYTSTAPKLFMRVLTDHDTLAATTAPEQVAGGSAADDFCLDERAGVAYVTTHVENTVDRVQLNGPIDQTHMRVAGDPLDERLLGPTSAVWGRSPGDEGRTAFVTTNGGANAPLVDGSVRTAKIVRLDL